MLGRVMDHVVSLAESSEVISGGSAGGGSFGGGGGSGWERADMGDISSDRAQAADRALTADPFLRGSVECPENWMLSSSRDAAMFRQSTGDKEVARFDRAAQRVS